MKVVLKNTVTDFEDIRALCIKYNWYIKGNSREYENMMKACNKPATPARMLKMAQDIVEHSEFQDLETVLFILYKDGVNHIASIAE